ncbi:MAG: hypothetical protein K0B07_04910 [DPANN group archaeon]|nr:hypothetical protein [DPANN group archaeon]
MVKAITVEYSAGVYIKQTLTELTQNSCTLFEYLAHLDISELEDYVLKKYYLRTPTHRVGTMIRLANTYYFYDCGYEKILRSLSEFNQKILKLKTIPSVSTLNDFVHLRLSEQGFDDIMIYVAKSLNKYVTKRNGNLDSTPNEAEKYDKHAKFNPHYECKMYKSHIVMIDKIPLIMTFSNGLANDSPYLKPLAYKLHDASITFDLMNLDGGYDSFENHALVKHVIGADPYIGLPINAVQNEDGTVDRIKHFCNKLWKQGGSKYKTIEEQLQFLFENDRIEQVGAYYRNINHLNMPKEITALLSRQERIHAHMKITVKFDVRKRKNSKKGLHIKAAFVSYQLLCLCALQNDMNPNQFEFIQ